MSEMTVLQFADTVRRIAGPYRPSDFAILMAQMIAAARLFPTGRDGLLGFRDQHRELTQADWSAISHELAKRWQTSPKGLVNPFEKNFDRQFTVPGIFEQLRRVVLSCLPEKEKTDAAPAWLLHSILDLARPKDFFSGGLDPDVRTFVANAAMVITKPRVFCAYDLAADIALEVAIGGSDVTFDVSEVRLAALCGCLAIGADLPLFVRFGDPLQLARADAHETPLLPQTYDVAIVCPPINVRHTPRDGDDLGTSLPPATNLEAVGLTLALARGKKTAFCLLPPAFLFRSSKAEQLFKEQLARNHGLETVIGLPRGVLSSTSIAAGLLIFKPDHRRSARSGGAETILMVDMRGDMDSHRQRIDIDRLASVLACRQATDISSVVKFQDLEANNFNLSPERYVLDAQARRLRELTENAPTIALEDIAELYRPQAVLTTKGKTTGSTTELAEVGVADIDEAGLVRTATKLVQVPSALLRQVRKACLEPGDVLLVIKGSAGKVGFVRAIPEDATWLASQSFAILRLRPHAPLSDSKILFRFLSSPLGQANLQSLRVGSAVPGLQMADVRRLPIVLPSISDQRTVIREVDDLLALQDQIDGLRNRMAAAQASLWPEHSQKREGVRHGDANTHGRKTASRNKESS